MDDPVNKQKSGRGNGAMSSPKKKPPASSPTRSPCRSVFICATVSFAAAVDRPVGVIDFDKPSPTPIVERV